MKTTLFLVRECQRLGGQDLSRDLNEGRMRVECVHLVSTTYKPCDCGQGLLWRLSGAVTHYMSLSRDSRMGTPTTNNAHY